MFPRELWSTLEGDEGEEVRKDINRAIKKKHDRMSDMKAAAAVPEAGKTKEERQKLMLELVEKIAKDAEAEEEVEAEGEPEDDVDYDYEDDEGDMGGDYDGEKYFDNGEGEDEDGGGGDAGGDDY